MENWHPEVLATIADRLGIAFTDLTPPRSRSFRTEVGPNIHVLDWGGQGPAVLLHGGSITARTWDYVAIGLRADFRLIALDMRGHGASDWANDYSIESYATDLMAVVDGLGIERTHIVGMSLGGMVACEFALRHPDRTESLAMVGTSRPVFAATARMRTFMTDFRGAATVDEVVEMALAVSPKSDPELNREVLALDARSAAWPRAQVYVRSSSPARLGHGSGLGNLPVGVGALLHERPGIRWRVWSVPDISLPPLLE